MLRFQIFLFHSFVKVRVYQPSVFYGEAENGLQCFPQLALRVGELSFLPFLKVYDVERNNLELLLRSFHPFFVIHILQFWILNERLRYGCSRFTVRDLAGITATASVGVVDSIFSMSWPQKKPHSGGVFVTHCDFERRKYTAFLECATIWAIFLR